MSRKKHQDNTGSWMDTYGDMVTLLMCFFILLYAISAVDQTKWTNLVRSLNPDAVETLEDESDNPPVDSEALMKDVPKDFETLYENLKKAVDEKNLNTQIEVKKGDGFTFISFKDKIFFDGDSYVLKDQGKAILDDLFLVLEPYANDIKAIEILGHTAELPDPKANSPTRDRFLSSNRATAVVVYMQEKSNLDPKKLIAMGYGQYWPVGDNTTEAGRAENRRVEMLITKVDSMERNLGEYYDELYQN